MLPSALNYRTSSSPRSLVDEFINGKLWTSALNSKNYDLPAVNVEENKKEYLIDVAASGLDKNDLKVNVNANILTISSKKEANNEEENDGYLRREFNYQSFCRSFTLPEYSDVSKIKASHKNGILSVVIPKIETKEQKTKAIKIT